MRNAGRQEKRLVFWGLLLVACGVAAVLAIYPFGSRHAHFGTRSALGQLRTIQVVEDIYRESDRDANGRHDYGTLAQLSSCVLVDSVLGSGTKQGYIYEVNPGEPRELVWWAVARPVHADDWFDLVLFTNQTGAIWAVSALGQDAVARPNSATGAPPPVARRIASGR